MAFWAAKNMQYLMVNQLGGRGGGRSRSFGTSTIPKLKRVDSSHHTHRERTLKAEYAPVFIVCGMVCVAVTIGSYTAYQQLACSPTVHVSKKRRKAMSELYDHDHTFNSSSKFINGSFLKKVSNMQDNKATLPDPNRLNPFTRLSKLFDTVLDFTSIARNKLDRIDDEGDGNGEKWVEVISWEPRAFVYHNFLTKEECEHLIDIAKPDMHRSMVVDSETGKGKKSSGRTSSGAFLDRGHDKIVSNIEKRIAEFTFIPVEHGEGLYVLHYEVGQKYDLHYDYFHDGFDTKNGGQRIATVLMYLTDVEEGGETVFPDAKGGNISSVPCWSELTDCGKKGLSIKPKRGDAVLFWSAKPDATLDSSSLHASCPVIKGNKWSCTKWIHFNEYKE